jgi:transcriptional regulator with XRE-family HTH domain
MILETIRQAMRASGKTRDQISKETGIPRPRLARLSRGETALSLESLEKLAHALDLEIILRPRSRNSRILRQPVETLNLSVRATNCLTQYAPKPIRTIRQLVRCTAASLVDIPKSGPTVVAEVRQRLAENGLRLKGED